MPVIGHTFVGLAIGMCARHHRQVAIQPTSIASVEPLWLPTAVGLSYLPDIAAQLFSGIGWSEARQFTHSAWFAGLAAVLCCRIVMKIGGLSFRRAFAVSLISVLVHDALDMCQATDRMPWWPIITSPTTLCAGILPMKPIQETTLFVAAFAAFLVWWGIGSAWKRRGGFQDGIRVRSERVSWLSLALIAGVISAAGATHYLRDARERELQAGRWWVEMRQFTRALEAIEQADRWPSTTKPGRADHVRAEAYWGLGDRARAEFYYLRSDRADPTYFWVVADLARFYSVSHRPPSERRRLAAPYMERLRRDFAGNANLSPVLNVIEEGLRYP